MITSAEQLKCPKINGQMSEFRECCKVVVVEELEHVNVDGSACVESPER